MTYRAEVLSVETLGDKLRVRVQETGEPTMRGKLIASIEVPLHQAKAYYIGRIVRVSMGPR